MARTPRETIRRVRLGNLKRLLRYRYGHTLPDDDAGREDLEELLCLTVDKNMMHVIETWAPWMLPAEAEALIAHVNRLPPELRWRSPRTLGERLRLTNKERERFKLWQIAPHDMAENELIEQRKAKARIRARRRRFSRGGQSREFYVSNSLSKQKPWVKEGISRRTWERRRAKTVASPYADQEPGGTKSVRRA
jgi:hypothetical protein